MVEVPDQSLRLIRDPHPAVVEFDISRRHSPVNQGENPEGKRDETNQRGLDAPARDQSHATFFLPLAQSNHQPRHPPPSTLSGMCLG